MREIESIFTAKKLKVSKYTDNVRLKKQYHTRVRNMKTKLISEGYDGDELNRKLYYYREMEKNKMKKGILDSYIKPTLEVKKDIRKHILNSEKTKALSMRSFNIEIPKNLKQSEFVDFATKKNLFAIFPALADKSKKEYFPCIIVDGNIAWIDQSHSGVWRYFSKLKQGRTIGLNIFDLIEISGDMMGTKKNIFINAFNFLSKLLDAPFLNFENEQIKKYDMNLYFLENVNLKLEFPILYKIIKSNLKLLYEINCFGKEHINPKEIKDDNSIFYVSNRHLEPLVGKNYNVINKAINKFAILGLINKVWIEDLSHGMIKISDEIRGKNMNYKRISFYTIPLFNMDLLSKAENIALSFKQYNIKEPTRLIIEDTFGKEKANEVYGSLTERKEEIEEFGESLYEFLEKWR